MLTKKLASDIVLVAQNKLQTKTAGWKTKALLGALAATELAAEMGAAYAYEPDMLAKADDYLHPDDGIINRTIRKTPGFVMSTLKTMADDADAIPYNATNAILDSQHKTNPQDSTLNYYLNKGKNWGNYELNTLGNDAAYKAGLGLDFYTRNFGGN